MTSTRPKIDEILRVYFDRRREGTTGVKRRRIELIDRGLGEFLEADGVQILCECNLAILASEREFQPNKAFARTMLAEDLVFALPLYLDETCADPLLRRAQLGLIDALVASLIHDELIRYDELADELWRVRDVLDRAKWELNRARREKQRAIRRAEEEEMARRRAVSREWFDGPRDTPHPLLEGRTPPSRVSG